MYVISTYVLFAMRFYGCLDPVSGLIE
jgi:hypothetical protein